MRPSTPQAFPTFNATRIGYRDIYNGAPVTSFCGTRQLARGGYSHTLPATPYSSVPDASTTDAALTMLRLTGTVRVLRWTTH